MHAHTNPSTSTEFVFKPPADKTGCGVSTQTPYKQGFGSQAEFLTSHNAPAKIHLSTNSALCCSTSVIGRELVFTTWYGRRHGICSNFVFSSSAVLHNLRCFSPTILSYLITSKNQLNVVNAAPQNLLITSFDVKYLCCEFYWHGSYLRG